MDGTSGKGRLPPQSTLSNYRLGKTLGIGAFGKVKVAEHTLTGVKVAIKILDRQSINDSAAEKVRREINIMRHLSHPHIVRLYEVIETRLAIYVIMEYMNSGELFDYITENSRLEEDEARHFFQQVDVQVLEEMVILGFNVHEVIRSLNNLLHNQATVTYSLLLHKRLSNHSYHKHDLLESLPPECTDRREIYVRPVSPVQGKWALGFKSCASPNETMRDVLTVFESLNVQWKKLGPYNMKCLWKPAVQSYSMPMGIHRLTLIEDSDCLNVPIKSSNKENFSLCDAVKFEIQLYKASAESYLLDWQRIYGPPFLFIELCAGFRACVIV